MGGGPARSETDDDDGPAGREKLDGETRREGGKEGPEGMGPRKEELKRDMLLSTAALAGAEAVV